MLRSRSLRRTDDSSFRAPAGKLSIEAYRLQRVKWVDEWALPNDFAKNAAAVLLFVVKLGGVA
jgi:hypothetical protein